MDAASVTLTVGDYVFYSIMGVCVVFFALILLMCIIKIMTIEPNKATETGAAEGGTGTSSAEAPAKDAPLAPGSAGDFKLYDTDPRDAAMVMAIVADELKKPLNELRFISIKECEDSRDERK